MKKMNFKKIILGLTLIIFSFCIGLVSTFVFDYFQGQAGREMLIVTFGGVITLIMFISGVISIISGVDKDF